MQSLHPKPPKHHMANVQAAFIHPGLLEEQHMFLRRDMLRRPLQQPYDGLSKSYKGRIKCFSLTSVVNGYLYLLIDANLPSFLTTRGLSQPPQTKNETPATVENLIATAFNTCHRGI
ncbi:hypothetical protein TNCV_38751 [Trichonephila clavipes]|nr:hypothetical protein TNCV_38751 [Trichonephila clavipes]